MPISLRDLLRRAEQSERLTGPLAWPEAYSLLYGAEATGPLLLDGTLRHRQYGQLVYEGRADLEVQMPCGRCLKPCPLHLGGELRLEFYPEQQAESLAENDDCFFYQGEQLELAEAILQRLQEQLPTRQLCSEDCAGISPVAAEESAPEGQGAFGALAGLLEHLPSGEVETD